MTFPYRTCALLGFTVALVTAGYFFAPSPGATSPLQKQFGAKTVAEASAGPSIAATAEATPTVKASGFATARPPVPLMPLRHSSFVTVPSGDAREAPELMQGQTQALAMPATADDAQARRAIEFDGYRNVRGLVKAPDGSWQGRALRGTTEITVRVAADGSVSAD